MPKGIYIRTKKHCENISKVKRGKKRKRWKWNKDSKISKEVRTCKRPECNNKFEVRMTSIKKYCSKSCSAKNQKRKPFSEETKRKIGKGHRGKTWEEIHGIDGAKEMRKMCKERKRKPGEGMEGKFHSYETIEKMRESHKRKNLSKETLEKMSKAAKKKWQNPKYAERQLKAMFIGIELKPTRPERKLRNGLNKLFPNEYEYVGDGTFWIGKKNPDFININSQKKIIELFGDYWHSEECTGISVEKHEKQRIKHFAKYGFKTLIIWEHELKNIPKLKRKLIIFNKT